MGSPSEYFRNHEAAPPRDNALATHPLADDEAGQASVLLLLMLSTFLLAACAFAIDLTGVWFHRQSIQGAADAACLAGATDMLAVQTKVVASVPGFTPGVASNCSDNTTSAICKYAGFNGYSGHGGLNSNAASNSVTWTFPASLPNVTAPRKVTYPFLQVAITENVKTYFMGMLGRQFQKVNATASCGLVSVIIDPPIVVLDPAASGSLSTQGSPIIKIIGGPTRSIEVDSKSATAVLSGGTTGIDTSQAGPKGTGADISVFGAETTVPPNIQLGTTGHWRPSTFPLSDPFTNVNAPVITGNGSSNPAAYHVDGCPDPAGCTEYSPGYYSSGISVQNATAIFDPGIYILDGDFALASNSLVRNAYPGKTGPVLSDAGVMFYMRTGAVTVSSNSGKGSVDTVPATDLSCDGSVPPGIPNTPLSGSVLVAQCTDDATYTGNGGTGTLDSTGSRSLLFFEAHTDAASPAYSAQGGGGLLFAGTEYFHSSTPGLMTFGGNPSGTTYLLGYIVTDQLALGGNSNLAMVLNPQKSITTLQVALLR